jgi:hypothetical protein
MSKESFLIYKSFYEPIKHLSKEDKSDLFDAIFLYQIEKKDPPNTSSIYSVFLFFKNQFRLDEIKYTNVLSRNKSNGIKGGRPKKPKKPSGLFENPKNPSEPKKPDNDNDNDNDNDKYKVIFESFRKKYPGRKYGLEVEYENFIKKNKDYKIIIPLLDVAIDRQIEIRKIKELQKAQGDIDFIPNWKDLQTWLNNKCWTEEEPIPVFRKKLTELELAYRAAKQ